MFSLIRVCTVDALSVISMSMSLPSSSFLGFAVTIAAGTGVGAENRLRCRVKSKGRAVELHPSPGVRILGLGRWKIVVGDVVNGR